MCGQLISGLALPRIEAAQSPFDLVQDTTERVINIEEDGPGALSSQQATPTIRGTNARTTIFINSYNQHP